MTRVKGSWLGLPAVAVESEADVPGFIRRHQQADDDPLAGIGTEQGRGRIAVDFGIKHFFDDRDALEAVEEALGAVVIALFTGVLMVGSTMALRAVLLRGFDEIAVLIQQADAVVGKEHELPEGLHPGGRR